VGENGPAPGLPICPVIKFRLISERFLFVPTTALVQSHRPHGNKTFGIANVQS
jgi:hypothetical protein